MSERSMNINSKTKSFLCSYHHDGAEWSVTIQAYDRQDAEARLKKLGFLRLDGELVATLPAKCGVLVRIICWFRNLFKAAS